MANNNSKRISSTRKKAVNCLLFTAILTVSVFNICYFHYTDNISQHGNHHNPLGLNKEEIITPKSETKAASTKDLDKNNPVNKSSNVEEQRQHSVADLSCTKYGGPPDEVASQEMAFWSDIPSDAKYYSPFHHGQKGVDNDKYLTFEPDHGGWNNIRMAMETALVMAHAMGRTLVLPPEQRMYLLGKDHFSFNDFFHLDSIALEHDGFDLMTMEDFLKKEGVTGKLTDTKTGNVMKPPNNKVDWSDDNKQLFEYLRTIGHVPKGWNPNKCIAAIPSSTSATDIKELRQTFDDIVHEKDGRKLPTYEDFEGKPTPVDAPLKERMREMLAERKNVCIYDAVMQRSKVVHFSVDKSQDARMLTHFYAFLFFQDWKQDLWTKRFVRDHVRYVDEIVCAAARIVEAVRERARKKDASNVNGLFDSFHVRRGDFQYKKTRLSAEELYSRSKNELKEGGTLFIATDERDKKFFQPLADKYDVCFLDDFQDKITGISSNYYGMLDQLVASKGRVFYGTWWSTLSGYINRMRGYYNAKHKLDGYEDGTMESYYFIPDDKKDQMTKYHAVKLPLYMREFPTSWLNIDKGIEEIAQISE
uniref:O-fucosyltransferase family protein n=1 Tax=Ditylum brightwellii TaxID=49249 RepID=A0A7S4VCN9_9STRA